LEKKKKVVERSVKQESGFGEKARGQQRREAIRSENAGPVISQLQGIK